MTISMAYLRVSILEMILRLATHQLETGIVFAKLCFLSEANFVQPPLLSQYLGPSVVCGVIGVSITLDLL